MNPKASFARLKEDPEYYNGVMRCIRCSICVPRCPSYRIYQNEADSPRGRVQMLRAVLEERLEPSSNLEHHLDRCLGCRACEDVCPSAVPYGYLLDRARNALQPTEHKKARKGLVRWGLTRIAATPWRMYWAAQLLRLIQALRLDRLAAWVLRKVRPSAALRIELAPRVRGAPFRASEAAEEPGAAVQVLIGCVASGVLGDVQRATIRALERTGAEVSVPASQNCCGALHLHAGLMNEARELARGNIEAFDGDAAVCVNAAGCRLAMREYPALFEGEPQWQERARHLASRLCSVIDLVSSALDGAATAPPPGRRRALVHEPCHEFNVQKERGKLEALLRQLGYEVETLPRGAGCCGSAGLFSALQPKAASDLLDRLLDDMQRRQPELVVSSNPGCQLLIEAGLRRRGIDLPVLDIAEVIDRRTGGEQKVEA